MTYWTIQSGALEKSLAAWGFDVDHCEATFGNMEVDTLTLATPGSAIESDPLFAFEAEVILRRNRTSASGAANSFSGGAIEFQGKRLLHVIDGRPDYEGILYQFGGPWYDVAETPFLQKLFQYTGDPNNLGALMQSDVILYQRSIAPGQVQFINNGDQIRDILQSLLDQYTALALPAPLLIGRIDPAVSLFTYQAKEIKCAEAIQMCLRASPDCVVWFDYTTTPPTINVTRRDLALPAAVTLADGVTHETINLVPRFDLVPRSVTIYFKQTNTVNGLNWISPVTQQAPAGSLPGGSRSIIQTIDMAGFVENTASGSLKTAPVTNDFAFWKRVLPEKSNVQIKNPLILDPAVTITDKDGNPLLDANNNAVTLANYPNFLIDGTSVAPWMKLQGGAQVKALDAYIRVHASYDEVDSAGKLLFRYLRKELVAHVTLTNGVTGDYSSILSEESGEPIPAALADNIFNALKVLQYQGTIGLVEQEVSSAIGMGNVLNLNNGRAEWQTMNAMIQQIHRHYGTGRTQITIGPAAHLSAADLTQIFLVNRYRLVLRNPLTQVTAQSSGGSLALGQNAPKENGGAGLSEPSVSTVQTLPDGNGASAFIQHDASGTSAPGATPGSPCLAMGQRAANGNIDNTKPSVVMNVGALIPTAGQPPLVAKWQPFQDSSGNTQYVLATAPVSGGITFTDYDPSKSYSAGQGVRLTSGNNAGAWFVRFGKTAAIGVAPIFPEPFDAIWGLISLAPQPMNVCQNGTKTIYVHASLPF